MSINATVIGTIFMDCKGSAQGTYRPTGRNLGSIEFVHGGVARNVAENLAGLLLPTTFISSVDRSGVGDEILQRLHSAGVNTKYIRSVDSQGMGMWLVVLDQNGDLAGSISQMPRLDVLSALLDEQGDSILSESSHIILELDLNETITKKALQMAKEHAKPVYGIPGNLDVIRNNIEILKGMECFICNDIEAGQLLSQDIVNMKIPAIEKELVRYTKKTGLQSMVITLGSRGAVYYDRQENISGYQPVFPVNMIDSTGAGDAFFSGTIMGLIHHLPLSESVIYGSQVAAWTIESRESTCPELSARIKKEPLFKKIQKELLTRA